MASGMEFTLDATTLGNPKVLKETISCNCRFAGATLSSSYGTKRGLYQQQQQEEKPECLHQQQEQ
jgi:hypothetical protein